jgi:hypothetical protein
VKVTWEALATERELLENPRFGRRPQRGALPTQKIVLVNASHPDARANRVGRVAREDRGVAVAAVADEDMDLFVRGLEQRGFFRLARPTGTLERFFADPDARGRITVERGGDSVTLVSLRGQGQNEATKAIPPMYSEVKQAIIVLRNQTPTLSVTGIERDPLRR